MTLQDFFSTNQGEFSRKIDALRKRQFLAAGLNNQLKTESFVPATGIGRFNALYLPAQNRINVTIKVRFWFNPRIGGEDSELAWTDPEKLNFARDAKQIIETFWSQRYRLECVKPGWTDLRADVFVEVKEVRHGEEDYLIKVKKIARYKSSGGIDHGQWPHICGVNNWANEIDTTKKVDQIFNFKEGIMREKLRESDGKKSGDFVRFGGDVRTLSPGDAHRLTWYADFINKTRTAELYGIKAFLVGITGKSDGTFSRNLSRDRTAAIATLLNQRVTDHDFARIGSKDDAWAKEPIRMLAQRAGGGPATGNGGVLMVIRTPTGVVREVPRRYVVMIHEAGHMLGLPDEYMGIHDEMTRSKLRLDAVVPSTYLQANIQTGNDRLRKMQEGMTQTLQEANVASPFFMSTTGVGDTEAERLYATELDRFYTRRNEARKGSAKKYEAWKRKNPEPVPPTSMATISSSIMHSGNETVPAHYITIWSALCKITAGYIEPSEWKIVTI